MRKITIVLTIMLVSLSMVLASIFTGNLQAIKKAKVTIVLNDYGCYKGKVKATLKNVDRGITFFKNKVIRTNRHSLPYIFTKYQLPIWNCKNLLIGRLMN